MNNICLALPTNRDCVDTIDLLHNEANYAVKNFNVQVTFLIIDTSNQIDLIKNEQAVSLLENSNNVNVVHLNVEQQQNYFKKLFNNLTIDDKNLAANRLLELMLPSEVSYGACTNRAFLLAAALQCDSIHRRDSDCHYQTFDDETVYPIHQELLSLGKIAHSIQDESIASQLTRDQNILPVAMVAASFIGEMSVDIAEINQKSPSIYHDVVKLWSEKGASTSQQEILVNESFKGAGTSSFKGDIATLGQVDPMLVDMCNISFHGIQEAVPLPPATDTIGSDYFLIHLTYHSQLPSVVHNRHIENFYTPERKTDEGFAKYQRRFVKFLLSMPYLYHAYGQLAIAGPETLLNAENKINNIAVCKIIESSIDIDNEHCHFVFDEVIKNYQMLGGRFKQLTQLLIAEKDSLISQAKRDMEDYLYLSQHWPQLIHLSKTLTLSV
jgi:hypothetical protein